MMGTTVFMTCKIEKRAFLNVSIWFFE